MSDPNFSAIRARLKYASIDAFIEGYSRFISSGGMFIPMAPEKLKPIGTTIRFQFLLSDGATALLGEGTVLQVRAPDDTRPNAPVGMLVKFAKLSQESKQLVDRIVDEKESSSQEEPEGEVAPRREAGAESDDSTAEFTQEEVAAMAGAHAADHSNDDPPTREAPSADELMDDEDEIALELERVDEEVRKEGGPKRLAGTDGGISVFAFDDMSDEDMKDFENFSFGGDEDEIDSMFDGLFGGGDDDDGGFFGDEPVSDEPLADEPVADEPAVDEPEVDEELFADDDIFADDDDFAAAAPSEGQVETPVEEPMQMLDPDDDSPLFPVEEEPASEDFEEEDFAEEEALTPGAEEDFDSPPTEIGRPTSVVSDEEGDEDFDLDFPEFDASDTASEEALEAAGDEDDHAFDDFDEPVEEVVEEVVEAERDDAFFGDEDELDFPMAPEEESVVELDSSVSFVEEITDDSEADEFDEPVQPPTRQESGVYDLIGSLDDDEEEELSLNLGHGALARAEQQPDYEEPEDEESLEALLASAQKEIESKRSDEEEEKPEGDIIDQLMGDDDELPPPPPDMPAFQLPDGSSKKKKGFISKLFGKD